MFESIIFVGVVLLTQFVKGFVFPKFGKTGVHVVTFVLALIGLGIYQWAQADANVMHLITESLKFLAGAIALYEVILSKIGFNDTRSIVKAIEDNR